MQSSPASRYFVPLRSKYQGFWQWHITIKTTGAFGYQICFRPQWRKWKRTHSAGSVRNNFHTRQCTRSRNPGAQLCVCTRTSVRLTPFNPTYIQYPTSDSSSYLVSKWEKSIKMELEKTGKVWIGCICLRIGTNCGLLWTRWWTFGFHKRQRVSWPAAWLSASEGWCSLELLSLLLKLRADSRSPKTLLRFCFLVYLMTLSQLLRLYTIE